MSAAAAAAAAASPSPSPFASTKILFFDVFGTVVDWRSTVTDYLDSQCRAALASSSSSPLPPRAHTMTHADWGRFAEQWRNSYHDFTAATAAAAAAAAGAADDAAAKATPYKTVDEHWLSSLRELLDRWELAGLWRDDSGDGAGDAGHVETVSRIWHALDPWPDAAEGLRVLRHRLGFQTSTLSNGNVSLLEDMARHAGLDWTHVTSAEMFRSYKPDPAVYLGAARRCGPFEPGECALVAAHLNDLEAARRCGFRTVYVERAGEEEWGPERVDSARGAGFVDEWVTLEHEGFLEAARRLAAHTGRRLEEATAG